MGAGVARVGAWLCRCNRDGTRMGTHCGHNSNDPWCRGRSQGGSGTARDRTNNALETTYAARSLVAAVVLSDIIMVQTHQALLVVTVVAELE